MHSFRAEMAIIKIEEDEYPIAFQVGYKKTEQGLKNAPF